MINKLLFIVLFLSIMAACSQQQDAEEKATKIAEYYSLEEVESILTEQGFVLEKADLPSENVFIRELNGVSPKTYYIEGNPLSIYVFPSASERGNEIQRFEEMTAAAELVEHKAYGVNNILVFYVGEEEKIQNRLLEALQKLESPE